MSMTAEQKIRQELAGNPFDDPQFAHMGEDVVRWLTGGSLPDAWVTFRRDGEQIVIRCAGCQTVLGYIPANYERSVTASQLHTIRLAGHEAHKPAHWPNQKPDVSPDL